MTFLSALQIKLIVKCLDSSDSKLLIKIKKIIFINKDCNQSDIKMYSRGIKVM